MPMGQPMPDPAQGAPQGGAPQGAEPQAPGGATQMVADIHTNLMKFHDLLSAKFPDDAKALESVIQQYQAIVDNLGQSQGEAPPGEAKPATTSPEAGAANVQQAM
jgi:hypothetical protein